MSFPTGSRLRAGRNRGTRRSLTGESDVTEGGRAVRRMPAALISVTPTTSQTFGRSATVAP